MSKIITVPKIIVSEGGENVVQPDTTSNSWTILSETSSEITCEVFDQN